MDKPSFSTTSSTTHPPLQSIKVPSESFPSLSLSSSSLPSTAVSLSSKQTPHSVSVDRSFVSSSSSSLPRPGLPTTFVSSGEQDSTHTSAVPQPWTTDPIPTATPKNTAATSNALGIYCLFYSEFDNTIGPRLLYQAPKNYLTPEDFEKMGDYVITKPELCHRVIGLEHQPLLHHSTGTLNSSSSSSNKYRNTTILSYPITIQNEKYARNSLLFSLGCIVDKHQDITPYYSVLTKLATSFQTYELENEFLFRSSSKSTIETILNQVLYSLQYRGECLIPINYCNTLTLKLFPSLGIPSEPLDYEVPVMIKSLDTLQYGIRTKNGKLGTDSTNSSSDDNQWDLALRLILPYINGIYYIKQISVLADIDKSIVKRVIQNLVYYGTVKLVDIFQYSNIYATTPQLSNLLLNSELRALAVKYISNDDHYLEEMDKYQQERIDQRNPPVANDGDDTEATKEGTPSRTRYSSSDDENEGNESIASSRSSASRTGRCTTAPPAFLYPSFDYVFRVYTSFGAGARVCDICVQYNTLHYRIDDRRLIRFGVLYGLLKRIHKYPVKQQQQASPSQTSHVSGITHRSSVGGTSNPSSSSSSASTMASLSSPLQQRSTSQAMPALPLPSSNTSSLAATIASLESTTKYTDITSTIRAMCNGTVPMEALCVEFGQSQTVLEHIIDKLGDYVYILR